MKMMFPSDMPIWEQLKRAGERKRVGRKHNKTVGPGRQKKLPHGSAMKKAAWRKYKEQMSLYMRGLRDTRPKRPDDAQRVLTTPLP